VLCLNGLGQPPDVTLIRVDIRFSQSSRSSTPPSPQVNRHGMRNTLNDCLYRVPTSQGRSYNQPKNNGDDDEGHRRTELEPPRSGLDPGLHRQPPARPTRWTANGSSPSIAIPRPFPGSVDVLDDVVDVSAGQDEQGGGVDRFMNIAAELSKMVRLVRRAAVTLAT